MVAEVLGVAQSVSLHLSGPRRRRSNAGPEQADPQKKDAQLTEESHCQEFSNRSTTIPVGTVQPNRGLSQQLCTKKQQLCTISELSRL